MDEQESVNNAAPSVPQTAPHGSHSGDIMHQQVPSVVRAGKRILWREIQAHSKPRKVRKSDEEQNDGTLILDNVSGVAEPGLLTFLMGASGAGKTTLLNILTQRNLKGVQVFGEVLFNRKEMKVDVLRRMSAYVEQEDLFMNEFTVKEQLMFSARLRMAKSTDRERTERIYRVAQDFNLLDCMDTVIGGKYTKSISRGERKRLSFACEILTDPQILFCDEPTSGLDSFMAEQVMKTLRMLAGEGKTVLCTIHQPSSQVFQMADILILMAMGKVSYHGPAQEIGKFLADCGHPCDEFVSLPDHFMRVISKTETEEQEKYETRVKEIIHKFEVSEYGQSLSTEIQPLSSETSSRRRIKTEEISGYAAPWLVQFTWLFWRGLKCVIRNPMVLKVRITQCIMTSLVVGALLWDLKPTKENLLTFRGSAFAMLRDMNIMFLFPGIHVFTAEMPIVKREYLANMYCPTAYFLGKNLADTMQYILLPTIYIGIVYPMAHYAWEIDQFLMAWLICCTQATTAISIAYAAACVLGRLDLATTYLPLFSIPMIIFGGFFVDLRTIPLYFYPLMYLSWYKYAFEALSIVFFQDVDFIQGCERVNGTLPDGCDGSNGIEILESVGFKPWHLWPWMAVLLGCILVWRTIAIVAFTIRIRRSR